MRGFPSHVMFRANLYFDDLLQLLNFCETDLDRCFATKQINIDGHSLFLSVDSLDNTSVSFQAPPVTTTLSPSAKSTSMVSGWIPSMPHLFFGQRYRFGSRSDESGHTTGVTNNIPCIIVHHHVNQYIAREHFSGTCFLCTVLQLNHILHRYLELPESDLPDVGFRLFSQCWLSPCFHSPNKYGLHTSLLLPFPHPCPYINQQINELQNRTVQNGNNHAQDYCDTNNGNRLFADCFLVRPDNLVKFGLQTLGPALFRSFLLFGLLFLQILP